MIEIIMEISLYLILAIVLGFLFGWFITKASWKERCEKEIEKFKELYLKDKQESVTNREPYREEEEISVLKRLHEKEVEAFLVERTDIIQKYKELLVKIEEIKKSQLP